LDITILTHEQIWSMRVKIFDGLNKVVIQLWDMNLHYSLLLHDHNLS
jgi:hypothetical protein